MAGGCGRVMVAVAVQLFTSVTVITYEDAQSPAAAPVFASINANGEILYTYGNVPPLATACTVPSQPGVQDGGVAFDKLSDNWDGCKIVIIVVDKQSTASVTVTV